MATLGGSQTLVNDIDDTRSYYQGAGEGQGKIGTEVEMAFYHADNLTFMSKEENARLFEQAAQNGLQINPEPFCDGLEISSGAAGFDNLETILQETDDKIRQTVALAQTLNLKRSFFEQSPQISTDALLDHIIDNTRYQAFFVPVRPDLLGISRYFVGSKSVQTSVSYENPNHLLDLMRRLAFLTPFLFTLTANHAPFMAPSSDKITYHPGMTFRRALGHLGGMPDYIFDARDGDDLINRHIQAVHTTPVFSVFNHEGRQIRLPEGQWKSLHDLKAEGLNTEQNYFQVQSMMWRDLMIKPYRNADGHITNHRLEVRMFGTGMHQHVTATLITAALAFRHDYAAEIDRLLSHYGFTTNHLESARNALGQAYTDSREHKGRFMDIPYGTGNMAGFAKEFSRITLQAYEATALAPRLAPLKYICETGITDSKAHSEYLCSMEMVKEIQKRHDNDAINNSYSCAGLYYRDMTAMSKCA